MALWGAIAQAASVRCAGLRRRVRHTSGMPFPIEERQALLRLKGVGPTVVARLEQLGFEALAHLSRAHVLDIVSQASALVGSTCWKNSPQARAAIHAAIALAQSRHSALAPSDQG